MVRQAVDKLPERLKLVVLLFYMEELSVKQTAEILKIPAGTVLSRLYQARKTLKKELESVINGKGTG
ncbi:ECF RNA polymerase sigma factor SigW [Acetatifactor muris]|uniref:ECF RNA polymerase sigma factor SigW n=1 Tax=Acetatifactor muris TaxID=879566 RepID=A0A2K4ZQN6_9FIRM|nr:ECF RNA polymerase sigma factor SigW [Acetatifactor muris]